MLGVLPKLTLAKEWNADQTDAATNQVIRVIRVIRVILGLF